MSKSSRFTCQRLVKITNWWKMKLCTQLFLLCAKHENLLLRFITHVYIPLFIIFIYSPHFSIYNIRKGRVNNKWKFYFERLKQEIGEIDFVEQIKTFPSLPFRPRFNKFLSSWLNTDFLKRPAENKRIKRATCRFQRSLYRKYHVCYPYTALTILSAFLSQQ